MTSVDKNSLNVVVNNSNSDSVVVGVRVLVGNVLPQHIPATMTLFGRRVATQCHRAIRARGGTRAAAARACCPQW